MMINGELLIEGRTLPSSIEKSDEGRKVSVYFIDHHGLGLSLVFSRRAFNGFAQMVDQFAMTGESVKAPRETELKLKPSLFFDDTAKDFTINVDLGDVRSEPAILMMKSKDSQFELSLDKKICDAILGRCAAINKARDLTREIEVPIKIKNELALVEG